VAVYLGVAAAVAWLLRRLSRVPLQADGAQPTPPAVPEAVDAP
jgi:hypothetical protein